MKKTVIIKGKEYPIRYGYGALLLAEQVTGKPWGTTQGIGATLVLMWCCLVNADRNIDITFDDFISACDEDADVMTTIGAVIAEQSARWGNKEPQDPEDKKKD